MNLSVKFGNIQYYKDYSSSNTQEMQRPTHFGLFTFLDDTAKYIWYVFQPSVGFTEECSDVNGKKVSDLKNVFC
ncbi:hypothetical protein TNCT_488321 [Trichonephila clavata]|uniref:Uncharacterized protein n=1 Tax=Trichonephila clavata TaxID=2740835 RepID=A0A8X6FTZ1_TRICU|nr:hypothetical protein TNCT_488321 [Trichonephila clavata]